MQGILASWAVLQVWRESDDVLPSRAQIVAAQMAPGTAHDMHACNTSNTTTHHQHWLACLLARSPTGPVSPSLPSATVSPCPSPFVSVPCDQPHCRGFVILRPSLAQPQTRACLFSRSMAPFGILMLSLRSPLSWWPVHHSPRLIIKSLSAGSHHCSLLAPADGTPRFVACSDPSRPIFRRQQTVCLSLSPTS